MIVNDVCSDDSYINGYYNKYSVLLHLITVISRPIPEAPGYWYQVKDKAGQKSRGRPPKTYVDDIVLSGRYMESTKLECCH